MKVDTLYDGQLVVDLIESASKTLYVIWTPNTYSARYNANGGEGSTADIVCQYGSDCTLTADVFTKSGYTLIGWSNTFNGSVDYTLGQAIINLTTSNNGVITVMRYRDKMELKTANNSDLLVYSFNFDYVLYCNFEFVML